MIIWVTGMPKAGKTYLASTLKQIIPNSIIYDGDELRAALKFEGFTKEDRIEWMTKVGNLALLASKQGHTAIVALVSPYVSVRKEIKQRCLSEGERFITVYIKGSNKFMWEGSEYEPPDEEEGAIILDRSEVTYEEIFRLYRWCVR